MNRWIDRQIERQERDASVTNFQPSFFLRVAKLRETVAYCGVAGKRLHFASSERERNL